MGCAGAVGVVEAGGSATSGPFKSWVSGGREGDGARGPSMICGGSSTCVRVQRVFVHVKRFVYICLPVRVCVHRCELVFVCTCMCAQI